MSDEKDWRKAERYSKKLFQLLTVKADYMLKNEDMVTFSATWQALTSRMICCALLMNELHNIGQSEKDIIDSMVNFAIEFKNENGERIAKEVELRH